MDHDPHALREQLTFLAEAGRLLSSSLDFEATLQSVARVVVPTAADYCVIDLIGDDGMIRRVATAHRDPAREALTAELRRFPPVATRPAGVPAVLMTGRSELVEHVTEELLRASTADPEHLRIVRELGPRSVLIVPLIARGHTLGAITFAYTEPDRRCTSADAALAEELAGHAALAVDNARLYRQAQLEIRERKSAREELARKHSFLQLLLEITTAANEAPDLNEALRIALERVRAHTGWPLGHAYLLGPDDELIATGLWSTDDPERFRQLREVTESVAFIAGIGLPGRVLATGRAVGVVDVATDPSFLRAQLASDLGVRAAFAFPVIVGTQVAAVLEFFSGRSLELDPSFLDVMAHVGTQLGRVVERERARAELAASVSARDDLLRMVSHDLRNPLSTIGMAATLLQEADLDTHQRDTQLDIIHRSSRHMERLVQGLLDFHRVEGGHGILVQPAPVDAMTLVQEGCTLFRPQADDKHISIIHDAPDDLPPVHADAGRILQVLWNLSGNAIKFTPPGGQVLIRARRHEDHVRFSVSDTGPGIAPGDLQRLFDPFWQAKRTARLGTGLGLPISRAIVEAHGGSIDVDSELGVGTTFHFSLPVSR